MRVCLFTPTFLPQQGGAERMADQIVRGLQQRGHQIAVLAQQGPDPRADQHFDQQAPYPVRRYRRPPAQHLWPSRLGRDLKQAHRQQPFDVALCFYGYPTGYAAATVAKQLHIKVVVSPRGGDLYPHFHALKKPRVPQTIAAGYQRADRIASISRYLTQRILDVTQKTIDQLPPIDHVPNGIDLDAFDQQLQKSQQHPSPHRFPGPFILHLARLHAVKQHHLALDAVAHLAPLFRQQQLTYAIAGDGPETQNLQNQIDRLQLQDCVQLLGHVDGPAKFKLLQHAQLFLTTSREEGLPNGMIEAMAAGLPALASDIDPHRELLEPREQSEQTLPPWGLTFQNANPKHLAQQLQTMLTADEHQHQAWRDAARQRRALYSLDASIAGYERSLQAALATPTT